MSDKHPKLAGAHVLLIKDGQIFLIRRVRGDWAGHYILPAGHVDEREPVTAAALREAFEEVAVIVEPENLSFKHVMSRLRESGKETVEFFFEAKDWSGEPKNNEPEKCDDAGWFPLDQLPKNTIPYIRQALDCIRRGQPFSEFGW